MCKIDLFNLNEPSYLGRYGRKVGQFCTDLLITEKRINLILKNWAKERLKQNSLAGELKRIYLMKSPKWLK